MYYGDWKQLDYIEFWNFFESKFVKSDHVKQVQEFYLFILEKSS